MPKKNPPIKAYLVNLQFHSFEVPVKARTAKEAREKAFAKTIKKRPGALIDRNNTFVNKDWRV
jgi:hypothetical protein